MNREVETRAPKRAYLVVHNGDREEQYLHWVNRLLEHSHIHVQRCSAPPDEMIAKAANMAAESKEKASSYDEVWCVITSRDADGALRSMGESLGVRVAMTWSNFDAWLLLHLVGLEELAVGVDPTAELKRRLPDVENDVVAALEALRGRYSDARGTALAIGSDGEVGSTVHEFVDSVRESLQRFYAEDLPRSI